MGREYCMSSVCCEGFCRGDFGGRVLEWRYTVEQLTCKERIKSLEIKKIDFKKLNFFINVFFLVFFHMVYAIVCGGGEDF